MTTHAQYSPSALHRVLPCPHSLHVSKNVWTPSSDAAQQGTLAHEVLEAVLGSTEIPDCPNNMLDTVSDMAFQISELQEGEMHLEERLDTGIPGCSGTGDVIFISDDHLQVIDYKHGRVDVDVQDNPQLLAYLLGAVAKWGVRDRMTIRIAQPFAGGMKSCEVSSKELIAFEKTVKHCVSLNPAQELPVPGDKQCQWCPGKFKCRAHIQETVALGMAHPNEIQPYELVQYHKGLKGIPKAIATIDTQVEKMLEKGQPVKGFKLVKGSRSRSFSDSKDLLELGEMYDLATTVAKDKTLPQVEKDLKAIETFEQRKAALEDLKARTKWTEGKPKVVYEEAPGEDYVADLDSELFS